MRTCSSMGSQAPHFKYSTTSGTMTIEGPRSQGRCALAHAKRSHMRNVRTRREALAHAWIEMEPSKFMKALSAVRSRITAQFSLRDGVLDVCNASHPHRVLVDDDVFVDVQ